MQKSSNKNVAVLEEFLGNSRIFTQNNIRLFEYAKCAERYIFKISDGGSHYI